MAHTVLSTCTQARACTRTGKHAGKQGQRDATASRLRRLLSAAPIQLSLCDVCWISCSMSCDGHSVQQCGKAPFTSLDSSTEKIFFQIFYFFLADRFKFFLTHCELSLYSQLIKSIKVCFCNPSLQRQFYILRRCDRCDTLRRQTLWMLLCKPAVTLKWTFKFFYNISSSWQLNRPF